MLVCVKQDCQTFLAPATQFAKNRYTRALIPQCDESADHMKSAKRFATYAPIPTPHAQTSSSVRTPLSLLLPCCSPCNHKKTTKISITKQ